MDWGSFIGPAVVAAGVSGFISVIGLIISTRTARAIHTEKLTFDERLAERKVNADIGLAEKKSPFDTELAERRFAYERELHDHKRRVELAEEVLSGFLEARTNYQEAKIVGGSGLRRKHAGSRKRRNGGTGQKTRSCVHKSGIPQQL